MSGETRTHGTRVNSQSALSLFSLPLVASAGVLGGAIALALDAQGAACDDLNNLPSMCVYPRLQFVGILVTFLGAALLIARSAITDFRSVSIWHTVPLILGGVVVREFWLFFPLSPFARRHWLALTWLAFVLAGTPLLMAFHENGSAGVWLRKRGAGERKDAADEGAGA